MINCKLITALILLTGTLVFSQTNILKDKKFKTELSESCSRTTTGGYMSYTYTQYEFGKDTVAIVLHVRHSNIQEKEIRKTCKYKIIKEVVLITREDYGKQSVDSLKIISGGLIGKMYGDTFLLSVVQ